MDKFIILKPNDKLLLKEFYKLYSQAFPDDNERESLANLTYYLSKKDDKNKYHILVLKRDNVIVGGAIFDYLSKISSGIIEYIFVDKTIQQRGMGKLILSEVLKILKQDAEKDGKTFKYLFCEIDDPKYRNIDDRYYFSFWKKNGLKKLDFNYFQPPLEEGKDIVDKLFIVVKPQDNSKQSIDREELKTFLESFFEFCFEIDHARESEIFKKNTDYLPQNIKLLPLEMYDTKQLDK